MKKLIKFITGCSAFLALLCLLSLSSPAYAKVASFTIKGVVCDESSKKGIAGAYVDGFSQNPKGIKAFIAETKTSSNGSFTLKINREKDTSKGYSTITLRVFSRTYSQNDSYSLKADNSKSSITGINIPLKNMTNQENSVLNYGLRESYYGLTRPYFDDGVPGSTDFTWPTDQATTNMANFMRDVGFGSRPLHVLIVTQTDHSSFQGQDWGPTFCLWRKDSDNYPNKDPLNLYFENLKDRNGNPMGKSHMDIDAILKEYDDNDQDVFLQVESGYSDINKLIPEVLYRFYKDNGVVKHSCIKGLGIDVEWYKNVDPTNDWTSMSKADGDTIISLVANFNPNLRVFFKHFYGDPWDLAHPNPAIAKDINRSAIIVDDSQGMCEYYQPDPNNNPDLWYPGEPSFAVCKTEFAKWAEIYAPRDVGFQIGYDSVSFEVDPDLSPENRSPRDRRWWGDPYSQSDNYPDPDPIINPIMQVPYGILEACAREAGRKYTFVWVDFSLRTFPINYNPYTAAPFVGLEECIPPAFGPWPNW